MDYDMVIAWAASVGSITFFATAVYFKRRLDRIYTAARALDRALHSNNVTLFEHRPGAAADVFGSLTDLLKEAE